MLEAYVNTTQFIERIIVMNPWHFLLWSAIINVLSFKLGYNWIKKDKKVDSKLWRWD